MQIDARKEQAIKMPSTDDIYTADAELAKLIQKASATGDSIEVLAEGNLYMIRVAGNSSIKASVVRQRKYDPKAVQRTIRKSTHLNSFTDIRVLDEIIAETRAQRDQAPYETV